MDNNLGKEITRLRKSKKLTQGELAEKIGFSRTYLADAENSRRLPSINFINEIAKGLSVSKLYLYRAAGYLDETDILSLVDENKRLREALEFYADKNNHVEYHESDYVKYNERGITEITRDKGQIARQALEGDTNA